MKVADFTMYSIAGMWRCDDPFVVFCRPYFDYRFDIPSVAGKLHLRLHDEPVENAHMLQKWDWQGAQVCIDGRWIGVFCDVVVALEEAKLQPPLYLQCEYEVE